jgi:leucyl aminopeptidase
MEYAVSGKNVSALKTDCLILAVDEKATLLPADLPADTANQIRQLIKDGDFIGKRNQAVLISQPAGLPAKRLLLVGSGELPLSLREPFSSWSAAPFRH